MSIQPSRRAVLQAAGVGVVGGLLAACTSDSQSPPPSPPTADELARTAAVRLENTLAERARATVERHPTLKVAATAADAHAAHAQALAETLPASPAASASTAVPDVPARAPAAARALAGAERNAAEAHRKALVRKGVSGELARLLASVAGSDEALALAFRTKVAS